MKILTDLHTHTVASDHGYCTIIENAKAASEKGIQLIAMTDHGPAASDGANPFYFEGISDEYGFVPKKLHGVTILSGIEANIINENGELDLSEKILKGLDIVIAGCHWTPFLPDDLIKTYSYVVKNPHVDILGHICRHKQQDQLEEVVKLAVEHNKLVEINASTLERAKYAGRLENLINLCLKHRARIVVSSDAHYCDQIGDFDRVIEILKSVGYPEGLVVNRTEKSLMEWLTNRNK